MHEGVLGYGELQFIAGMNRADGSAALVSMVSLFETVDASDGFIKCIVADLGTKVDASNILASLTFSMSDDRSSCIPIDPS